jgi:ABC-2 type transport system ATP-binding protein
MLVRRPESLVVDIPVIVFVLMLPGLLYHDLIFDVQRSKALELGICFLPPSAIALLLRELFYLESMNSKATLRSSLPISNTSFKSILGVLLLDCALYSACAVILFSVSSVEVAYARQNKQVQNSFLQLLKMPFVLAWNLLFSDNAVPGVQETLDFDGCDRAHDNAKREDDTDFNYVNAETVLSLSNIQKGFYLSNGQRAEVLADITAELKLGYITCFLGGNGAGKSTLLKLLCGLDDDYDGVLTFNSEVVTSEYAASVRKIGYCPQRDALFDQLTVRENLELFVELDVLGYNNGYNVSPAVVDARVHEQLSSLDMLEHGHKLVSQLSGGMKRRLSLALAFVGNPLLILLDEPTTGCDSFTRELVRNDIIKRRQHCAVVVSTHHMDDVELLADRVWFLNEKYLQVNSSLRWLRQNCIISVATDVDPKFSGTNDSALVEFTTTDVVVTKKFHQKFYELQEAWTISTRQAPSMDEGGRTQSKTWRIPSFYHAELFKFIEKLERDQDFRWQLHVPSLGEGLVAFMSSKMSRIEPLGSQRLRSVSIPLQQRTASRFRIIGWARCLCSGSMLGPVGRIRIIGLQQKRLGFLRAVIVVPFIVAFIIAYSCANLVFPPLKLTSQKFGGIGEVPLSASTQTANNMTNAAAVTSRTGLSDCHLTPTAKTSAFREIGQSNEYSGRLMCLAGKNSDMLFDFLFNEYYTHSMERWGAFVTNDTMAKWAESSLVLVTDNNSSSPDVDRVSDGVPSSRDMYTVLQATKKAVCGDAEDPDKISEELEAAEKLWDAVNEWKSGLYSRKSIKSNTTGSPVQRNPQAPICSTAFELINGTSIKLTSYKSLSSILAMMTNVTLDHVSPVFLKEITTTLFGDIIASSPIPYAETLLQRPLNFTSALLQGAFARGTLQRTEARVLVGAPKYSLSSYPLPLNGFANKTYLERGYLGSIIIVLFMQIATISCVKYIVRYRQNRAKISLHLVGVGIVEYWVSNWIVDVCLLVLVFASIVLAIAFCGSFGAGPVMTVFGFQSLHRWEIVAVILLFAAAIVPSSYVFCLWSTDPLSSQLSLLVFNIISGVCLRLMLDAKPIAPLEWFGHRWIVVSPTFAFTTGMFDVFTLCIQDSLPSLARRRTSAQSVFDVCLYLQLQAIGYLVLAIMLDKYSGQLACWKAKCFSLFIPPRRWYKYLERHKHQATNESMRMIELSMFNMGSSRKLASEESPLLFKDTNSRADGENKLIVSYVEDNNQYSPSDGTATTSVTAVVSNSSPECPQNDGHFQGKNIVRTLSQHSDTTVRSPVPEPEDIESNQQPHSTSVLLSVKNVSLRYGNSPKFSINGLTLSIRRGERVALVGINGGGKSTLFRYLALGQNIPEVGSSQISGLDVVLDAFDVCRHALIGYVPQDGGLIDYLTVHDYVDVFYNTALRSITATSPALLPLPGSNPRPLLAGYEALVSETGGIGGIDGIDKEFLLKYARYPVRALSGGNKKKLALLLARLTTPALLLLDECTSGVDPIAAEAIVRQLYTLRPHQAVLFTSHRIDECIDVCDRVVMLCDGSVVFDGPTSAFESLSTQFYQVDVWFAVDLLSIEDSGRNEPFKFSLTHLLSLLQANLSFQKVGYVDNPPENGSKKILLERVVQYGPALSRLTFEKSVVPLSICWSALEQLIAEGHVIRYSFRTIDMEETLAILIAHTKATSRGFAVGVHDEANK